MILKASTSDRRESLHIAFKSHITNSHILFLSSMGQRKFLSYVIRRNWSWGFNIPRNNTKLYYYLFYLCYVERMKGNFARDNFLSSLWESSYINNSVIGATHCLNVWKSLWTNFNIKYIRSSIVVLKLIKAQIAKVGCRTQKWTCMIILWLIIKKI